MKTKTFETRKNLADELADRVRGLVQSSNWPPNAYLPAERELCDRFKVSRVTVRRALGRLVNEGLLEAIPQKGYRPHPVQDGADKPLRLAFIAGQIGANEPWDYVHAGILNAFQQVLLPKSMAVVAVGVKGRAPAEVLKELLDARVNAVALDTSDPFMQDAVVKAGLRCVIVDAISSRTDLDVVLQDNHEGARIAVRHLLARGHKRIGWLGPTRGYVHWSERFGGAREGLWAAGLEFAPEDILQPGNSDAREEAAVLLKRRMESPDAPAAWVCLWQKMVLAAGDVQQAQERKLDLCGWSNEREYRELLAPAFLGGEMPAMVTWRPEELAELAWERLELRAREPRVATCRINVKVRLAEPRSATSVLKQG